MTANLSGKTVLMYLFGFFGIIFAANAYFIIVSSETFRGEDEQKPYLQGVEYNETLARRQAQNSQGLGGTIDARRLADGVVRIDVTLSRHDGRPIPLVALTGELRHPADETRDRPLTLIRLAPYLYRAVLPHVPAGQWDVVVRGVGSQIPFEAERRVWVP